MAQNLPQTSDLFDEQPSHQPSIQFWKQRRTHFEGRLYPWWELKDEGDNWPESPEQNWEEPN